MAVTCIRGAAWVIAWERGTGLGVEAGSYGGHHQYRKDVDIVFDGTTIVHVGPAYQGPVDEEIRGDSRLVMPGLVNVHCHPSTEPLKKGFREEFGNRQLYMSPLYDRAFMLQTDDSGLRTGFRYAVHELLKSGVTSIVDLSTPYEGWAETTAETGIRSWLVPSYASSRWSTTDGHSVDYLWDEPNGLRLLDQAVAVAREAEAHPSGRLSAMLGPAQIDTCTEELFRASVAAAADNGWRVHTHASQSLAEFQEMTKRHGRTPIQWAEKIGLLGPECILAHAMFTDEHSWTRWPGSTDRATLAETGTGVAHCPGVFARNGQVLEDLGGYIRRGVRLGIGTDSFPHNMLEELRIAAIQARITTGDVGSVTTSEVFHAATVGGADLVGRADLGRVEVGARADLVLVDLAHPSMRPIRDPLRSLVYTAADRAVNDVFVDGTHVVRDGIVTTMEIDEVSSELQRVRDDAERNSANHHYDGLSAAEVAPLSLPNGSRIP